MKCSIDPLLNQDDLRRRSS